MNSSIVEIEGKKYLSLEKDLVEKYNLESGKKVTIPDLLVERLFSSKNPRESWDRSFEEMRRNGDDRMIDENELGWGTKENPREGWEEQIRKEVEKHGQPELLFPDVFEDEDFSDWTWDEEE